MRIVAVEGLNNSMHEAMKGVCEICHYSGWECCIDCHL